MPNLTLRLKNISRSPPNENSSELQFFFRGEVTTDFGKSKSIHKAMNYAVFKVFFRWQQYQQLG